MKIKYLGNKEELNLIENKIKKNDIEFVYENEDYILKKTNHEIESIVGKIEQSYYILHHKDVVYIESLSNDVIAHTMTNEYYIKEKLYSVSSIFEPYGFLRIHKSFVVNINYIDTIIPQFNRKFTLVLKNNHKIEVSRSYYDSFKEYLRM